MSKSISGSGEESKSREKKITNTSGGGKEVYFNNEEKDTPLEKIKRNKDNGKKFYFYLCNVIESRFREVDDDKKL